jgi:hypothetical protein
MAVLDPKDFISLEEAGKLLPQQPGAATLRRWSLYGFEGSRLGTYRIGKQRVTTIRDMLQFIADLNGYELDPKEVDEYYRKREEQNRAQDQDVLEATHANDVDAEVDDDVEPALTDEEEWEPEYGLPEDEDDETPRRIVWSDPEPYPAY